MTVTDLILRGATQPHNTHPQDQSTRKTESQQPANRSYSLMGIILFSSQADCQKRTAVCLHNIGVKAALA